MKKNGKNGKTVRKSGNKGLNPRHKGGRHGVSSIPPWSYYYPIYAMINIYYMM